MKVSLRLRRTTIVLFIIFFSGFFIAQCVNRQGEKKMSGNDNATAETTSSVSYSQFSGSAKCAGCHKDIYEKHIQTAHYLTSQPAEEKYISGSFKPGNNTYSYNPLLRIDMEKRDSGFYQVVYYKGEKKKELRFDIVTGSGVMGQSYLYWRNNKLFQMPVSYFTAAQRWSNSPGFPDKVMLDRPITARCLECHVTYAGISSAPGVEPEEYHHDQILFGVDCEKCHGPAANHVAFHTENTRDTIAKYIINSASLSRQQNLDMCVLCHGGNIQKTKPSFTYIPGKSLADYFKIDTLSMVAVQNENIDVHGNQFGLLRSSKCFQQSTTMTCNTCHNPHEKERGKTAIFSQRCMSCHTPGHDNFCKVKLSFTQLSKNCIDCHMPARKSMAVAVSLPGEEVPRAAFVRSHFISIYPDETKKMIENINK
ncbi:MAG: hypothetical protein IPK57_19320 [Chitinophagaceae bacterium]|nr:hypothetical protein [Chitinophagaceae bacterium]